MDTSQIYLKTNRVMENTEIRNFILAGFNKTQILELGYSESVYRVVKTQVNKELHKSSLNVQNSLQKGLHMQIVGCKFH